MAAATSASAQSTPAPIAVPPPLPPLALEAAPPPVQPIELGPRAAAKARRPAGPDVGDLPADPDSEVPVQIPSMLRLGIARLVDGLLVGGVGALAFLLETSVTGVSFRAVSHGWLDRLAEWLSIYGNVVVHAFVVATIFGLGYSVRAAGRTGQTLGRRLTNTVLVRRNGKPFSVSILVVRVAAALVSTACLGAGFLWAVVDPYHRAWHDIVSGTVTVRRYVRIDVAR